MQGRSQRRLGPSRARADGQRARMQSDIRRDERAAITACGDATGERPDRDLDELGAGRSGRDRQPDRVDPGRRHALGQLDRRCRGRPPEPRRGGRGGSRAGCGQGRDRRRRAGDRDGGSDRECEATGTHLLPVGLRHERRDETYNPSTPVRGSRRSGGDQLNEGWMQPALQGRWPDLGTRTRDVGGLETQELRPNRTARPGKVALRRRRLHAGAREAARGAATALRPQTPLAVNSQAPAGDLAAVAGGFSTQARKSARSTRYLAMLNLQGRTMMRVANNQSAASADLRRAVSRSTFGQASRVRRCPA